MKKQDNFIIFKFLVFLIFLLVTAFGIIMGFSMFFEINNHTAKWLFILILSMIIAIHLSIGIGIVLEKKWGFCALKIYLYLSLSAFPIGTFISFKVLNFIKNNNISEHFTR